MPQEPPGTTAPKTVAGSDGPDALHRRCLKGLRTLTAAYRRHSFTVLRVSVGLLFVWFGALKLLPHISHAEDMATRVMHGLTNGAVPADVSRPLLAAAEILIGTALITGVFRRLTLLAFLTHMAGTFTTLAVLPAEMWDGSVAVPTMAGQYVIKNIVLVAACLAIAVHQPGARRLPGDEPAGQCCRPRPAGRTAR
jgi:uncharacterized membrane protein YkgB